MRNTTKAIVTRGTTAKANAAKAAPKPGKPVANVAKTVAKAVAKQPKPNATALATAFAEAASQLETYAGPSKTFNTSRSKTALNPRDIGSFTDRDDAFIRRLCTQYAGNGEHARGGNDTGNLNRISGNAGLLAVNVNANTFSITAKARNYVAKTKPIAAGGFITLAGLVPGK